MKPFLAISTVLFVVSSTASVIGQDASRTIRPTSFVESRQGNHPDGPDSIGHASITQYDILMCMLVEVYDETHRSQTACVLKFKDGPQRTLNQGESMLSYQSGEFSLECRGRRPRRCMIEVNPPPVKPLNRPGGSN